LGLLSALLHGDDVVPQAIAGAANLVAGTIRLDGGTVAFPDPDDKASRDVDIFAIIKGPQYKFKVSVGTPGEEKNPKGLRFSIPVKYQELFVLGLVRTGPTCWDVLELDAATIERHRRPKGGLMEVVVDHAGSNYTIGKDKVKKLAGFRERP
jgi:hypothetical protein